MMKQRASIDELTVEELSQVSGGLWEEAAVALLPLLSRPLPPLQSQRQGRL